jgi:outer membrane receptor protein involved in Fe transport
VNQSGKRGCITPRIVLFRIALLFSICAQAAAQTGGQSGVVIDQSGSPVHRALLSVRNPNGTRIEETTTDNHGRFSFASLPPGSYVLHISATQFEQQRMVLEVSPRDRKPLAITLSLEPLRSDISVTASRGSVVETESSAALVNVEDRDAMLARPLATIGNALDNAAGILVQQSARGQASPFLRGLTGYQVLNLIDGVRFNNSTFRSGPNQYLAFAEPGQAQRIEAMLGPASSQYGSDALGGAIQLITPGPRFSEAGGRALNGELRSFAASADASVGADATVSAGGRCIAWLAGGAWRRHNDLRAGGGLDSHHVFKRFFGLTGDKVRDVYGSRQQDTGFAQFGAETKVAARLADDQNLTLRYQQSELQDVRGTKDLWGGLGRLRSDFDPQTLRFFYARYEKSDLGFLDSLSGTFSVNSQSDGSIRQGLRATNTVTTDRSLVNSFGYAVQATTHIGDRNALVFGGEIYNERIAAGREDADPPTGATVEKRALYPNGSRYTTLGLFAQDAMDLSRGRLRATLGGRYTRVSFRTFADRNRDAAGKGLGVINSSQAFDDLTFNASLSWQATSIFAFNFLTGRGFRAPNLNDLGALGLNDLGYEIPAEAAVAAGGLAGVSDGEGAASTGRKVSPLKAERLFNYELGATLRSRRIYVRAQVFDAELKDPIVRRALLFPAASVPAQLAGIAVTPISQSPSQRAQNVVSVAAPVDPRAVKAFINEGAARYYGLETLFSFALSTRWSAEGNYSFLVGRELDPNRFVRRLPPQQGYLTLRFQPGVRNSWIELSGNFSGAQERLSGGDVTDERIGASRRRRDITDFFQGSLVRRFINAGADGAIGTADDIFAPTGETLAQIRDRVLPIGATINGVTIVDENSRAPLYVRTAGFASLNLRGGIAIAENVGLNIALMNLFDRNYRAHGSGIDAPGINLFVGLKYSF